MGYNTHYFDFEAHYASKSTKQLEEMLRDAEAFTVKYPQFSEGRHNEYVHTLKCLIAERIGRK